MRAIIIGAGRGQRLMPMTADVPKCYAEVGGKRIIDWTREAFHANGITDICFIGGYRIELVQRDYPDFTFRHNADWQNNNILMSLMHAADLMDEPFVCSYSDCLFSPALITGLLGTAGDIVVSLDLEWRDRYAERSLHPPDDAEKALAEGGRVTSIHRGIDNDTAYGEYTGVAKFSKRGATQLLEHFHKRQAEFAGKPFREAKVFEKAYLIHLLEDMIETGTEIRHADSRAEYIEIDTQEDFDYARRNWPLQHKPEAAERPGGKADPEVRLVLEEVDLVGKNKRWRSRTISTPEVHGVVSEGMVTEDDILQFMADNTGFEIADVSIIKPSPELLKQVHPDDAIRLGIIPVSYSSDTITIAMADALDAEKFRELDSMFKNKKLAVVLLRMSDLGKLISEYYNKQES